MVKLRSIRRDDKRAISPILGYVLLVTLGLIMSGIAYNYLKTYVPQEAVGCPDGVSLFMKDYSCSGGQLNITMKNNGKFNMAGYFIHASNNSAQKVATINLAKDFINSSDGEARSVTDSYIVYSIGKDNFMTPKIDTEHWFNMNVPNLISVEITPVRYETINDKQRFAICSNAKIKETIVCS